MRNKNLLTVSLLIPVYNSPGHLKDLFTTIKNNTLNGEVKEIIIGDDSSDDLTKTVIKEFSAISEFNIKVVTRNINIGYLRNINDLYSISSGDIAVLLNTDTLLPPNWCSRILSPFTLSEDIALVTPFSTNATNLTILPNIGQSWLEVDFCLSSLAPKYPDAHTAIGFCLGVQKKCFKEQALFNESYTQGYWEETDLHYRAINSGYRSIVADNILVYHTRGSSSFLSKHGNFDSLVEISNKNKEVFDKKWGKLHSEHEKNFKEQKPYNNFRCDNYYFKLVRRQMVIDVLFVLPAIVTASGGINVVIEFAKQLMIQGINASIYTYGPVDQSYIDFLALLNPWRSVAQLQNSVKDIRLIYATHYSSVEVAEEIATHYSAQIKYLVQGAESTFNNGIDFWKVKYDYSQLR